MQIAMLLSAESKKLISIKKWKDHVERMKVKQIVYKQQKPQQTTNTKNTNKPTLFIKYNCSTYKITNNS